jgi:predicted nucleic acid-binding protein
MTDTTFVDTNILVYARDSRDESKQLLAQHSLERLWQERTGRVSAQVLSEYYVTLTRRLKPGLPADAAWDDVEALMAWKPQATDRAVLLRARDIELRFQTSWWNATIVAAAQVQGCRILLSEDFQHGMTFDQVTVRNPFTGAVGEPLADYITTLPPRSRHRPRGRPPKSPNLV